MKIFDILLMDKGLTEGKSLLRLRSQIAEAKSRSGWKGEDKSPFQKGPRSNPFTPDCSFFGWFLANTRIKRWIACYRTTSPDNIAAIEYPSSYQALKHRAESRIYFKYPPAPSHTLWFLHRRWSPELIVVKCSAFLYVGPDENHQTVFSQDRILKLEQPTLPIIHFFRTPELFLSGVPDCDIITVFVKKPIQ